MYNLKLFGTSTKKEGITPINKPKVVIPNASPKSFGNLDAKIHNVIGIVILKSNIPSNPIYINSFPIIKHIIESNKDIVPTLLAPNLSPSIPPIHFPNVAQILGTITKSSIAFQDTGIMVPI